MNFSDDRRESLQFRRELGCYYSKNSVTREPDNEEVQITWSVSLKPVTPLINGSILPMEKNWKPEHISPSHDTETQQNDSSHKKGTTTYVAAKEFFPAKWRKLMRCHLASVWQQHVSPKAEMEQGMEHLVWNRPALGSFYFDEKVKKKRNSHSHLGWMVRRKESRVSETKNKVDRKLRQTAHM